MQPGRSTSSGSSRIRRHRSNAWERRSGGRPRPPCAASSRASHAASRAADEGVRHSSDIIAWMYPTLIKIGSFEITTFGLMMFLAFVAAGWVLTRQFRRYGLSDELASTMVMAAAIGGIVGAKIYYAILYRSWHELFARAGLVWYGGLIGGVLACSYVVIRNKVDWLVAADATAPALAIGYALGRIGCFLVGDDYGAPTSGWWGIAFPKG